MDWLAQVKAIPLTHAHTYRHAHIYTCKHALTLHAHTHARTRTYACTHTRKHAHTCTRTHVTMHVCTHARTHAHTHARTHMHVCTLTRAHTKYAHTSQRLYLLILPGHKKGVKVNLSQACTSEWRHVCQTATSTRHTAHFILQTGPWEGIARAGGSG